VADIRDMATGTRVVVENLSLDNQSHNIHQWLQPSDPSTNYNKAKGKRQEGTGSWFLENRQFKEWKSGVRRYLWLQGIPGCGKTVLCSTIIEHLRQNQEDCSPVVLDFFFDFNDTDKQSQDKLVRSLVTQLYSRCENSREELNKLYSSHEDGRRQPLLGSLLETFQHMTKYTGKIQIVIDALDECKTRDQLLPWMRELSSSGNERIYLIVASRVEEDIKLELERWSRQDNFVSIQQNVVSHDIRTYVRNQLRKDSRFERWRSDQSVQNMIETKLMEKAGGM
jgi:NACHT domain